MSNRSSEREVGRTDQNREDVREASNPRSERGLEQADDRGGSRDGERVEPDAGDRDQLDNDGGRPQSRR
jgi:hypothetical protein